MYSRIIFATVSLFISGCTFDETGPGNTGELIDEDDPKPERCLESLAGPVGFSNDEAWEPFVTGDGSIEVGDGLLNAYMPGKSQLSVTGLQTTSTALSLKDRRFYVKIVDIPTPFNNRSVRMDFIDESPGAYFLLTATKEKVIARFRKNGIDTPIVLANLDLGEDYPYYVQLREENDVVYFEVGKTLSTMTAFAAQHLDSAELMSKVLSSRIRIYTLENIGASEPVHVQFGEFNSELACE